VLDQFLLSESCCRVPAIRGFAIQEPRHGDVVRGPARQAELALQGGRGVVDFAECGADAVAAARAADGFEGPALAVGIADLVEAGDRRAGRLLGEVRIGLALAAALAGHGREPAGEILPERRGERVLRAWHGCELGFAEARRLRARFAEPARLRRAIGNARVERALGELA